MAEHRYHVTFMVAPPQSLMWADSAEVELEEAVTHVNDHDRVIEKVKVKRGLMDDFKVYVMSCTPINKRGAFKRHPWQLN